MQDGRRGTPARCRLSGALAKPSHDPLIHFNTAPWASIVSCVGIVLETGVFALEGEPDGTDGAVALLADNDLRDALFLRVRVVDLIAVDEQDQIGILLDRP